MEGCCQEYKFLVLARNSSLMALTRDKVLQLHLCRVIAYTLLRSNAIRTNVKVIIGLTDYAIVVDGGKVKGLRVDDGSCVGFVRTLLRKGRMPGAKIISLHQLALKEDKSCRWNEVVDGKKSLCCNIVFDGFPLLRINDKNIYTWYIGAALAILLERGCRHDWR